jgi:hypothetical protein
MPATVPNAKRIRKNYRAHDQVTVGLEFSLTIVWCRGWISTPHLAALLDQASIGLLREHGLRRRGDHGGVDDAAEDEQERRHHEAGLE